MVLIYVSIKNELHRQNEQCLQPCSNDQPHISYFILPLYIWNHKYTSESFRGLTQAVVSKLRTSVPHLWESKHFQSLQNQSQCDISSVFICKVQPRYVSICLGEMVDSSVTSNGRVYEFNSHPSVGTLDNFLNLHLSQENASIMVVL